MSTFTEYLPIISWLFGSGVFLTAVKIVYNIYKAQDQKTEALKKGVQALLRDRLYEIYFRVSKEKSITANELANFENLYQNYHALGQNGVMDVIHENIKKLPIKKGDII